MRHLLFILLTICFFSSCRMDDRFSGDEYGSLKMDISVNEDLKVLSRSEEGVIDEAVLKENSKIRIYKDDKLVDRYRKWSDMPSEGVILPVGTGYSVFVVSGDSLSEDINGNKIAATFDQSNKFYKGTKDFEVRKGQVSEIHIESNIANTLVEVLFEGDWSSILTEGTVNVSIDGGSLDYKWGDDDLKIGYYSLPYNNPELRCIFTGISKSGRSFRTEYIIKDAKESTKYTLTYKPSSEPVEGNEGGIVADIKVNAEPLYKINDEIEFYQRPVVSAVDGEKEIDLTKDMTVETGYEMSPVFTFLGSTPLNSIIVETELFKDLLGIDVTSVDLMKDKDLLLSNGFGLEISADNKKVTLSWNNILNPYLSKDGVYFIKYIVTDTYNNITEGSKPKVTEVDWRIISSNIVADVIPRFEIWATKATLYGKNLTGEEATGRLYFRYKQKDSEIWNESGNVISENSVYKFEVKGLIPGTTYQYQMMNDDKPLGAILDFTTEEDFQFPNAGFDNWSGDLPKFIFGKGENMFWDSGNHGSQKVSKNVTEPDETILNSKPYSARLTSMFASMLGFGQFAAGNIFIGEYLETQMSGITGHGVIGLGRPCSSRPLGLKGYVKYISGKVDKGGNKISNGTQDQGIIYMALTDEKGPTYEYGGKKWSFIIRTKESQFFSKDNENVIAYGEQIWTESTPGEGMHEFKILFNYDEKEDGKLRIPTRILLVGASSRYGDYFQGSTESKMWLDDLELIYDESEIGN